jgi:hypothetical protein
MSTLQPAARGAIQRGSLSSLQASILPSPLLFQGDSRDAPGDCDLWQETLHRLATIQGIATPAAHWDSRRYLVVGVRARPCSFLWL